MARTPISILGKANDQGSILVRAVIAAALLVILVSAAGLAMGSFSKYRAALGARWSAAAESFRAEAEKHFGDSASR